MSIVPLMPSKILAEKHCYKWAIERLLNCKILVQIQQQNQKESSVVSIVGFQQIAVHFV